MLFATTITTILDAIGTDAIVSNVSGEVGFGHIRCGDEGVGESSGGDDRFLRLSRLIDGTAVRDVDVDIYFRVLFLAIIVTVYGCSIDRRV